jgi:ABC-type antimicrobial peptide transport system permease subunit
MAFEKLPTIVMTAIDPGLHCDTALLFVALAFFGFASLILSALGICGLVSFIATSRVGEAGIRMAPGAKRGNIAALVIF